MTKTHLRILRSVHMLAGPGCTARNIEAQTQLPTSNLGEALRELVAERILYRFHTHDGRQPIYQYALTKTGMALLAEWREK